MRRILRPRRLHFERATGFSRELDPATGGSLPRGISESFHLRAPDPMSGVTLSETGSGQAPPSHRDRPLTQGDPYRAPSPCRPMPGDDAAAPTRRRDHGLQASRDAACAWCLPGRPTDIVGCSLGVKVCSLVESKDALAVTHCLRGMPRLFTTALAIRHRKGMDGCGKACLPALLHHVVRAGFERLVGCRSHVALTGWGKGRLLGPRGSGGLEGVG